MSDVTINVPSKTVYTSLGSPNVYKLKVINWTGTSVPIEHVEDSKKLTADAYVYLYQLILSDKATIIHIKPNDTVTWQGDTYSGTGVNLTGVGSSSDEERSRPVLTLFNPEGVYSYPVDQGLLDNAIVKRIKVLREHIDSDEAISQAQQWRVSRVSSLRNNSVSLELRDMMDGHFFLSPARMFIPPEFPQVSLK